MTGFVGAILLFEVAGILWLALAVLLLGTGTAVYLGSRVAPCSPSLVDRPGGRPASPAPVVPRSHRGALRRGGSLGRTELGCRIPVGGFIAWRRIRTQPLQAVRTAEGRSLRYRGTAPFQHSDVDRKTFFGRDREIRSLFSLVLAERLVVLFGKSGTGKSSLINAGLAEPLLERGYLPMTVRLSDRARGPLGGLLDGVRTAAHKAGVEIVGGDESDLWRFFKTAEFWSRSNDLLHPVLVLDQFEELFTLHAPAPRRDFIAQLGELLRGRGATGRVPVPSGTPGLDPGPFEVSRSCCRCGRTTWRTWRIWPATYRASFSIDSASGR